MKKSILLFAGLILFRLNTFAQDTYNLIIFSEDGDGFYAIVNGIRQNDKPETNVKITGLNAQALNVRVEFDDKSLPKLKQNMAPEAGFEHTMRIKKNMKKEMKLQYFGRVALADAPNSSGTTIAYHTSENPSTSYSSANSTGDNGSNTTVTTTSTTTQVNSNPNNGSFNINAGGAGINMNVNGMGVNGMNSTTSTTVTTTSSSSSSSSSGGGNVSSTNNTQAMSAAGCSMPMSQSNYEQMKQSVDSKPFSETKMSTAKVATKNACLSAAQIKGICGLFSMDDDKLAYAKFAYNYCTDKANYYQVSEVFSFSNTTDQLNKFLEKN